MLNDPTLQYARDDDQDPEMPTLPQMGGAGLPPMGAATAQPLVGPVKPEFMGPVRPESDELAQSQAAPAAAPKTPFPMITAGDLQQAQDQKLKLAALGAVGNAVANQQSAGNFYLGRMAPKQDVSGTADRLSGIVDQGIQNKKLLQEQALKGPEIEYMRSAIDPNSDQSKTSVQLHQALLKKYGTGLGSSNPEMAGIFNQAAESLNGKSAYDVQKLMDGPLGKVMSQEDIATTKNQLMAMLAGTRIAQTNRKLDQGDQRIATTKDNQAAGAATAFDKDHILSTLTTQQQQIRRDKHTLDTAQTLTPQMFNEINLGIANAISGGKAAAVTTQGKVEYDSLSLEWTGLQQRLSNHPQDIGSPEVKKYIGDVLNRLDQAYSQNMQQRAGQVAVGKGYQHNPAAQKAVADKVESYQGGGQEPTPQPSGGEGIPGVANAQAAQGFSDQDRKALAWAQANPKDPRAARVLNQLLNKSKGQ